MARNPTGSTETRLDTALGTEPLIVVEIDWNGGTTQKYADKDYGTADGKILEISGVASKATIDAAGMVNDITLALDDTDGSIKEYLDTDYEQKSPARVYLAFADLSYSTKFLLFDGEVNLPIRWLEGGRRVELEISSIIETSEVGFSPEQESSFDWILESSIGKMWPLCFGSALRVPAVKIVESARGVCLERFSILTIDELRGLAEIAYKVGSADYEKDIADRQFANPWITISQSNYSDLLKDLANTRVALITQIDALAEQNETQRDNLHDYADAAESRRKHEIYADVLRQYINTISQNMYDEVLEELVAAQSAYNIEIAKDYPDAAVVAYLAETITTIETLAAGINALLTSYALALIATMAQIATDTVTMETLEDTITAAMVTTIQIDNKGRVEDGVSTDIILNNLKLVGTFSENTFTILESNIPTYTNLSLAARQNDHWNEFWLDSSAYNLKGMFLLIRVNNIRRVIKVINQIGTKCTFSPVLWDEGATNDGLISYDMVTINESDNLQQAAPMFLATWKDLLDSNEPDQVTGLQNISSADWEITPGDIVYFVENASETYIVNDMATTSIHEVLAKRNIDGETKLVPVPTDYYTKNLSDTVGGRICTTITMTKPLDSYMNEGWGTDIFVSLISTEGSNTADIIEWIIDTWTDYSCDATTFASVKAALTNYPMHCAIMNKKDALELIRDIAFQNRCAVWLWNNTIYIKYLATAETKVLTFDESNVIRDSLIVTSNDPEAIETKMIARWHYDYADKNQNEIVIRNNINKYGMKEGEIDFWAFNIEELVQKSATFWHIRKSNVWKIIEFSAAGLSALRLEALDPIELDFTGDFTSTVKTNALVLEATSNLDNSSVKIVALVPVLVGKDEEHPFFWAADASSDESYPSSQDPNADDGYVTWDEYPSDTGDALPADPIVGRAELDYAIYVPATGGQAASGITTSTDGSASKSRTLNKDDGRTDYTDIDLHKTNIVDNVNELRATLGQLFKIFSNKLHFDISELNFHCPISEAQAGFPMFYDESAEIFRSNAFFPVKVTKDGGSAGTATTSCSWTYTIRCLHNDAVLGYLITPDKSRTEYGAYAYAPDASTGMAYYKSYNDGPYLLWVDEIEEIAVCP